MIDRETLRRVAIDTLAVAVADMQLEPHSTGTMTRAMIEQRIRATVWLVSRAATAYFDLAGVDQLFGLRRCDWAEYAENLLDERSRVVRNPPSKDRRVKEPGSRGPRGAIVELDPSDRRLLVEGIRVVQTGLAEVRRSA